MSNSPPPLSSQGSSAGSVALFTPITAPVLRSVDPVQVAAFLKERERYEMEIAAKQAELTHLQPAPYKASIDRTLLRNLLFIGKLENTAPGATIDTLNETQIETYISSLVKRANSQYEPAIIEHALESLAMPMHIIDPDARVTQYCSEFFERLESIGCGDFKIANPKKTVQLLLQRVQPPVLRAEMRKRVQFDQRT